MINPTLIRKNPPAVLRLFAAAAAGRTGQRAQSPPTGKMYAASVCVFFEFVMKVNPQVAVYNAKLPFISALARSLSVARYTKGSQLK